MRGPPADRAIGAMLGTFVGDALGMAWEGAPGGAIPDVLEMQDDRLGRGTYTDDTEMMSALAESLVRCDLVDEEDLARAFVSTLDPRRGYGAGTLRVLRMLQRGVPVQLAAQQSFDGQGSLGNGAAMRIAPVAVRFCDDHARLITEARRSARVTHTHPVGVDGAVAQATAVAAALHDDDPLDAALAAITTPALRDALDAVAARTVDGLDPVALGPEAGGVPPTADASVAAAIVAGARAQTFEQAVTAGIRAGGDTDTVGAMAGAVAGARFGHRAIPERWLEPLEDGERGRGHVIALATELASAARRSRPAAPRACGE